MRGKQKIGLKEKIRRKKIDACGNMSPACCCCRPRRPRRRGCGYFRGC